MGKRLIGIVDPFGVEYEILKVSDPSPHAYRPQGMLTKVFTIKAKNMLLADKEFITGSVLKGQKTPIYFSNGWEPIYG